jgi:hypothetical protein
MLGNQAIQRQIKGKPGLIASPDLVEAVRTRLTPMGAWREFAEATFKPEDLPTLPLIQLPPGLLPGGEDVEPRRRSDEFIVSRDGVSLTIVHPSSDSRIRVVAEDYRFAPEQRGGNVRAPVAGEAPAITYNLIAPNDVDAAEVLVATGPGAYVEMDEPVPYEGAREETLQEEWEHGGRPARLGTFDLTIVEMPDNALVPLPGEPIDVKTLLAAGGRFHSPDRRTWRGAVTYEERVMTIGMIIGQLAMLAVPLALELVEAVLVARAAAAMSESGVAANAALEVSAARLTTATVTEEIAPVATETAEGAIPRVAGGRATGAPIETPLLPSPEPLAAGPSSLAAELDAAFQSVGGSARGYTVRLCNDATFVETPTGFSNAGLSARNAGGAVTDVPNRTVWVHESVVQANGVSRSWGARLNLRQVVAHEIGHAEAASFNCCVASRTGADLSGLTATERLGLLDDAVHIAPLENVPISELNLPPGFKPPTP